MAITGQDFLAAITGGSTTLAGTYTSSLSGAILYVSSITVQNASAVTASCADTVNGAWTVSRNQLVGTSYSLITAYKLVTGASAQTPTVTWTIGTSSAIRMTYASFTGFTGTPTLDLNPAPTSGTGTTVTGPAGTTNFANEVAVAFIGCAAGATYTPGAGSNKVNTIGQNALGDQFPTTAGTSVGVQSGTLGASDTWASQLLSFYDATATSFTLACANGSYAMTGEAAILAQGSGAYTILASTGSYAYVGANANSNLLLPVATGSYALAGQNIGLQGPAGLVKAGLPNRELCPSLGVW